MLLTYYCILLTVFALSRGNENYRDSERDDEGRGTDNEASFDSPVYEASNTFRPSFMNGNPAYNVPPPALSPAYFGSFGYGYPYPYGPSNRYGTAPSALPASYGANAILNNPMLMCSLMSRLGYTCYASQPYVGRSANPNFQYNFVGGIGNPFTIRRGPVPITGAPASPVVFPPAIGPPPPVVPSAQPSTYVPRFSNDIPGAATSVSRVWVSPTAGKGGQTGKFY